METGAAMGTAVCEDNGAVRVDSYGRHRLATGLWDREAKARVRWDGKAGEWDVLVKMHDGWGWIWQVEWTCETREEAEELLRDDVLPRIALGEFEEYLDGEDD